MASLAEKIADASASLPEPEPLLAARPPQEPFPVGYLSETLKNAVNAIAEKCWVPHSLAVQSVLSACSLAVQPHFNVVLPTGQERPTSLFLVSVAESGDRKSTSDDVALEAVRAFERDLEDAYGAQLAEANLRQTAWDEARREVTNRLKKSGREALEQGYRDLGPRPEGPIQPTIAVRTGTTQGFLKRFSSCRPSLGLMSDEGGSWLGGYGMSEDNRLATIATLSDFWDGKTVQMLTSGEGMTSLRGRRLTFHMMVQPMVADLLLGNEQAKDEGFLSRILVSRPESLAGLRIVDPSKPISSEIYQAISTYTDRLARIVRADLPIEPDTMCLQPRALPLTEKARLLWWDFYNSLERKLGPGGELRDVKGFVGKLPEMAARIAANVAVFEKGAQIIEIDDIDLGRGIGIAQFYLSEAVRLFGKTTAGKEYVDAQELSTWLSSKWEENLISVSAVSRSGPSSVRNNSDYIRSLFALLTRHNHLAEMPTGGEVSGKRVRQAWRILVPRA